SGVIRQETLGVIHDAAIEAIVQGPDLRAFAKAIEAKAGPGVFLSPAHLETTFRDAVNEAYSGGMDSMLVDPVVGDTFPFYETMPIRDSRLTELCRICAESGINGTAIYRRDDPTWARIDPPRWYNCRCSKNPLTARAAARRGIKSPGVWVPMPEIAIEKGL